MNIKNLHAILLEFSVLHELSLTFGVSGKCQIFFLLLMLSESSKLKNLTGRTYDLNHRHGKHLKLAGGRAQHLRPLFP